MISDIYLVRFRIKLKLEKEKLIKKFHDNLIDIVIR